MARTTEKGKRRIKSSSRGKNALRRAATSTNYFAAHPLSDEKPDEKKQKPATKPSSARS